MRERPFVLFRKRALPILLRVALVAGLTPTLSAAAAQDYASREVGSWRVAASKDARGCFLTKTFDGTGETTLLLGMDIDGSNHLSVLNDNWSIEPQERLKLDFRLSNGGYSKHPVVGMASAGKKGFVTNFEAKFPSYFAGSKALHIARGKVPVEQLSLQGSGAAIAELRRCVERFKKAPGGPSSKRRSNIPTDPFAEDAKQALKD